MADAFDVEALLDQQVNSAKSGEGTGDLDHKDKANDQDRSRSRSRERKRDDSRDRRRKRSPSSSSRDRRRHRDRDRDRSGSRDRRHRDRDGDRDRDHRRDRDRDRRDRSRDRVDRRDRDRDRERERERVRQPEQKVVEPIDDDKRREREAQLAAEREATRAQREIDDLTKDQRTIFVGQLTRKVGERELENFFGQIGRVRSVIMLRDKVSGAHKGFAYVEMAELEKIPDCLLFNNVVPDFQKFPILIKASEAEKNFLAKKDPFAVKGAAVDVDPANDPETRMYVGNLHVSLDESALKQVLDQFGPTESVNIHRDNLGNSKGFAFVKYFKVDAARMAMNTLGGLELAGRMLKVGPVTDQKALLMMANASASGSNGGSGGGSGAFQGQGYATDASGNWKLDADEGGAGMTLNSQSRQMLMAKLGQSAGMNIPMPVLPNILINQAPAPVAAGGVPPIEGRPSQFLRLANMFDPATETDPTWDQDIADDVRDECSKFGAVELCKVETRRPGGLVFLRMSSIDAAEQAARSLHGRFFAGRQIIATFLDAIAFLDQSR